MRGREPDLHAAVGARIGRWRVIAQLRFMTKSPYGRAAYQSTPSPGAPGPVFSVPSRWRVIDAPPAYRQRSKQRLLPS
jgi:hypothetical protein